MLIRISGGIEGIKEYLEAGKKAGRALHRDQLDERVVLAGDLELADAIIRTRQGRGERYLHITLSFKEDHLSHEQLQAIAEEFRRFTFAAFDDDEFHFYAEAHLPRQKTLPDRQSGGVVERKPHVHIVIPTTNLLSGRNLNPFGKVVQNTTFIDAFQEHINRKFGLASPKDHRRPVMGGPAGVLGRHKGDLFGGTQREFKRRLLELMMDRRVESFAELQELLGVLGEVRIRNQGKPGECLNFKPMGQAKGINLKDFVFTRAFCDLPLAEKRQRLAEEQGGEDYQEPGTPLPSPQQLEATLREWYDVRAAEIKFLNSGSTLYRRYREANEAERTQILEQCRTAFYDRLRKVRHGADIQDPGGSLLEPIAVTPPHTAATGRSSDSLISQLSRDALETRADKQDSLHRLINLQLDARRLLAELAQSHGVIPGKYQVVKGRDGGDRIVCGRRHLNLSDFLTKEVHLPWSDAKPLLEAVYARQQAQAPVPEAAPTPAAQLWRDFNADRAQRVGSLKEAWAQQRALERARREAIKTEFQATRARILTDPRLVPAERRARQSLARMLRLQQERALRVAIASERARLTERGKLSLEEQYLVYLQDGAAAGNASALAELRRMQAVEVGVDPLEPTVAALRGTPIEGAVELLAGISYQVAVNGDVTYAEEGVPVLVDQAKAIRVLQETDATIEMGLRLALARFGPALDISGPPSFRQAVARIVVEQGFAVDFTDAAMQEQIAMMRKTEEERRTSAERRAAYQRAAQEKKRQETIAHLDHLKEQAKRVDLPAYLAARRLPLKKEGKGWMTAAEPRWHFFVGQDGQWMARQGDDYVDGIGFLQRTVGLSFREAIEALAGPGTERFILPSSSLLPSRGQNEPLALREPNEEQRRLASTYAMEERGVSRETLQFAVEAGFVAADDSGVAFLGRDAEGQMRSIETRFLVARTIQGELTSKRSYAGSDKTFPPVLPGNPAEVHIVEGGFDALALHDIARRRGEPPPTVIVTAGARVLKWLDNPYIQHLLSQAELVVQQRDLEMRGEETDLAKQAKTDAGYAAQLERMVNMIGKDRVTVRSPAPGFKDLADQNRQEGASSSHRQSSDGSSPELD